MRGRDQSCTYSTSRTPAEVLRLLLEEQAERIREADGTVAGVHLRLRRPVEQTVALSKELGARIVVVGSQGQNVLRRAILESVSENIIRYAHCPVFVVRANEGTRPA